MSIIKKAREDAGYSQKSLAEAMGVSQPTVCDWESGKKFPAGKNLIRLCTLLHCTSDYLLIPEEDRLPTPLTEIKKAVFGTSNVPDRTYEELLKYADYLVYRDHIKKD